MSAVFCVLLLISCLQTGAVKVEVPPPQNVTMIALNTNYRLSWDWGRSAARNHSVAFTTQYLAMYKWERLKGDKKKSTQWSKACPKAPDTHCDLTRFKLHHMGIYMVRVQAEVDGRESEWVEMEFCPDKDAAIGPPTKVELAVTGGHLDVSISAPVTSTNTSMMELLPDMYYTIIYWEQSTDKQGSTSRMLKTQAKLVTLSDLKAWTLYCVSVQSRYDYYNKSSALTPPRCIQTEGATPWWQIFLYFLLSLVICFLLVLLPLYGVFRCYRTLKATLFPSAQLPAHLQEYLYDLSPGSDIPRLLSPVSEEALVCDEVFPQAVLLEVHDSPPSEELDPDCSIRHSRQDSGGSRDSGVYSTEGGSGQQQPPHSGQTSAGVEDFWRGHAEPVEVKMHDIHLKVKSRRLIIDEGVVDMSV